MIVRKPTKIVLKLEDDIAEYEEVKNKLVSKRVAKDINKFTPNAFVTPNSIKLESESRLEDDDSATVNEDYSRTFDNIRSNPLFGPHSDTNMHQSADYIASLLQNIIHDNDDDPDEEFD